MDYSQMMRGVGGAVGGMGQAMMDRNFSRTYDAGRSGGYRDLMENQQIGQFARTGRTQASDPKDDFRAAVMDADIMRAKRAKVMPSL